MRRALTSLSGRSPPLPRSAPLRWSTSVVGLQFLRRPPFRGVPSTRHTRVARSSRSWISSGQPRLTGGGRRVDLRALVSASSPSSADPLGSGPSGSKSPSTLPPSGSPPADPFLLAVRKRWPPQQIRHRLVHELCNLLDEPTIGPVERATASSLLEQTEGFAEPGSGRARELDAFRQDVSELRRRVQARVGGGEALRSPVTRRLLALDVPDATLGTLAAAAADHGVFLEELLGVILQRVAEGLARDDSALREPLYEVLSPELVAIAAKRKRGTGR